MLYVEELKRNGYENVNYRAEKLLKRLQDNPIKHHVYFMKVDHDKGDASAFWLVYSSNITVSKALALAYNLGSADKFQDVALHICRNPSVAAISVMEK